MGHGSAPLFITTSFNFCVMDGPQDDLKWFGEGFDGFPKRLPEDTVAYILVIVDSRLTQKEVTYGNVKIFD